MERFGMLLDGKEVANRLKEKVKTSIAHLSTKPGLAVISVGDNPASKLYIKLKRKMCEELGIYFEEFIFNENATEEEVLEVIDQLNENEKIHGILVQSPVPYHINILKLFDSIAPEKDVDGFHPINVGRLVQNQDGFVPCTPLGIMHILKEYQIPIEGKNCVVVGRSNIVGRPMAQLLINANGTVTVCHSKTKNLADITKQADILIVAVGKPNFITSEMVKEGAVVVDVGINRKTDSKKICGDVDFETVKDKCSYITPVPGGVGPMTIMTLMENVVKSCQYLSE